MSVEELVVMLLEILREVQEMSGRPAEELAEGDTPIGGLAGFDSLNGIEVTTMLAARLKCEISGEVNLFISADGCRALTVREVAQRVKKLLSANRE